MQSFAMARAHISSLQKRRIVNLAAVGQQNRPASQGLAQIILEKINERIDPRRAQAGRGHDDIERDIAHPPSGQNIDQSSCIQCILT